MRPRVLVITPNYPPRTGGIEALLSGLVRHWSRIEPVVLTPDVDGAEAHDAHQRVRTIRTAGGAGPRSTALLLNSHAVVHGRRLRPAAVLSGHIVTSPAAAALSHLTGAPFVQYLYGREIARRPRLASFAIGRSAAAIAISAYTERLARSTTAGRPIIHRVPPGLESAAHPAPAPRALEIVAVARLVERSKGHDTLLEALPTVLERFPAARLTIVGDGPLRPELEALAARLGVRASVDFVGRVADGERNRILARAAVFALPTRLDPDGGGEGFGIVYLEASAYGVPVVAGDVGGTPDAVLDGKTGLLAEPTDSTAVAAAILRLLDDPELARRLGEAGVQHAASFAWPGIARRVEDVLIELIGAG